MMQSIQVSGFCRGIGLSYMLLEWQNVLLLWKDVKKYSRMTSRKPLSILVSVNSSHILLDTNHILYLQVALCATVPQHFDMLGAFLQVELVILPRSVLSDNLQDQQQEQQPPPPPPPPPPQDQDSSEDKDEEEEEDQEVDLLH
jgi:hypothetical protein